MAEYLDANGVRRCDVSGQTWQSAQQQKMVAKNLKAINANYNHTSPKIGGISTPYQNAGGQRIGSGGHSSSQGQRPIDLLKVYLLLVMAIACIGFAGKFVIFMYGEISSKLPPAPAASTSTKVANAHPKKHLKPTNPTDRLP